MQQLTQALDEMRGLYERVVGQPAPALQPQSFAPFPIGVDPVQLAQYEVRQVTELVDRMAGAPRPGVWAPTADTFLADEEFVVRVELAGVSPEDLKVFVVGGECVVRGERKAPRADTLRRLSMERPWGTFERRFVLPFGSRLDALKARFADGVLEVRVPVDGAGLPKEQKVEVA